MRKDRIEAAQALMAEQGFVGIMIMNHDDLRYFFGKDWSQPRAIIPWKGPPALIAFAAEAPQLRSLYKESEVQIFTHVGEQINDVITHFKQLVMKIGLPPKATGPKVGMQLWFDTPAFLVDLFRKVNPMLELVSSDSVMDELRGVKEPEEFEFLKEAQRIAGLGMDRARELLRPNAKAHDIATEVLYTMMKAGSSGTSTPIHVNFGIDSCMIHGRISEKLLASGDLVVIDLTPQFQGYCANLARTFIMGEANEEMQTLLDTYEDLIKTTKELMKPGAKTSQFDAAGKALCQERGLEDSHISGISHGIGLRFEETPASTIQRTHRNIPIKEDMTLTIGHTILAIPGVGGVRHEDIYRVTKEGGVALYPYPIDPVIV
ncbi:MAG: Xaa-Pro peptidase family protein [Planctomycetota bacterium]|nr:Xaa-Pro peptidase family protein [Planctomycetota bacterium]